MRLELTTYTPWGYPDTVRSIIPGSVITTSTPGHGGIGVDADFAKEQLSDPCLALATYECGIYWFEEDVAACAPMLELLESAIFSDIAYNGYLQTLIESARGDYTKDRVIDICKRTLENYEPKYMRAHKSKGDL